MRKITMKTKKLTLNDCIFLCMRDGRYWTFYELQDAIHQNWGRFYSENSISAGIRDLRKRPFRMEYGLDQFLEVIEKKAVENLSGRGRHYKYRLVNIVKGNTQSRYSKEYC